MGAPPICGFDRCNGAIIGDLTKDDFVLLEQGRAQNIQYFSTQGDLPLSLGLLVDTSMSQEHVLTAERTASLRFLDQVPRLNPVNRSTLG